MKKMKFLFTFILTFIIGINSALAVCETSEMTKTRENAYRVSVSYDLMEREVPEGEYTPPDGLTEEELENYKLYDNYFNVYINNITDDLYINVKNSVTGNTTRYDSSDAKDGVITIETDGVSEITDFTIDIFPSNEDCGRNKIRSISQRLPKYNEYSEYQFCQEVPNYYLCREYIDFDINYSMSEVADKANSYYLEINVEKEDNNETAGEKVKSFFTKHKTAIIVSGVIIVGAGVATTIVIVLRKRGE